MRKPQGYAIITDPSAPTVEMDTFTCAHCNTVKHVRPRERPEDLGGFCRVCTGIVCSDCVGKGCDPFEEKLKRAEERHHTLKSYGM